MNAVTIIIQLIRCHYLFKKIKVSKFGTIYKIFLLDIENLLISGQFFKKSSLGNVIQYLEPEFNYPAISTLISGNVLQKH